MAVKAASMAVLTPTVCTTSSESVEPQQSIKEHQHDEEEARETNHGVETLSNEAAQAVEAVEAAQAIEAMEAEAMADVAKDLREVSESLKPYIATTTATATNESNE